MRFAYFGYDFFYSCLDELVKEGHTLVKLFTFSTDNKYNFNYKVVEIANKANAPICYDKPKLQDIEELFEKDKCDFIISAGYIYKIPVLKHMLFRGVNVHPTLLPKGRGPWPLPTIILHDEKESGVTLHKMTEIMDAGDILIQGKFELFDRENLETLSIKSQLMATDLIKSLMANFDYYWENAKPQGDGEYWAYPSDEEMTFDGYMRIKDIDRIIRAFGKFDSCAEFLGKHWLINDAVCWEEKHNFEPNSVVHQTNKEILLAAVDGFVCIRYYEEDHDYD